MAYQARPADFEVAIIGSGFGGIGAGYRLKEAGMHDFVIFERAFDVGGTWRQNTYPGCQCDIPSHLYSLSFALNPNWSRTYPLQEEIRDYLRDCAARFGLMPHLRFGDEVFEARWNDADRLWELETTSGLTTARVVIAAQGSFSEPRLPDIPGRDTFEGVSLHSAEWDHDVDLAGKSVAVIGTGASAIQLVPNIRPEVGRLHLFQRTPPWVMPHTDRPITNAERWLYRRLPVLQRIARSFAYLLRECASPAFNRDVRLIAPLEIHARRHMRKQVKDPVLRTRLTPNYRLGCKRILLSNEWYPALQKDNVEVVTDGIAEITPRGIRTSAGQETELDVIIYATGFEVTDVPFAKRVVGRGRKRLSDVWDGSPQAYKNTTVPAFPNLFLIPGLQTGYSSQIFMIESQLNYVIGALSFMRRRGVATLEVAAANFRAWNESVEERLARTVWSTGGCTSWYVDRNGLATMAWPDFTWRFRRFTRRFDPAAHEISYELRAASIDEGEMLD